MRKIWLFGLLGFAVISAAIIGTFIAIYFIRDDPEEIIPNDFPKDFLFGASSSSYQIEGAWNEDGRTPSIWDTLTQNSPELIQGRGNGDVAANSYHLYKEDVKALKETGVSN